jgi:hypothetical protein
MNANARGKASLIEISQVITRADGTVQDLGIVSASYSWRKPIKKVLWPVRRLAAGRRIKRANKGAVWRQ